MPISGKLNKEQNEAVTHPDGPLLILAGAGSGKTRTITHRIAYLLDEKKESPYSILAVTFTNKAANEMKDRINKLVKSGFKGLWMGTFHSVCLRILKRDIEHLEGFKSNFTIFDDQDQVRLIKDCLKLLDLNERVYEPRAMRAKIDGFKNRGSQLKDINIETHDEKIRDIYELYEEELRRHNGLDFSDLLSLTVKLFKEHPKVLGFYQDRFKHILVDEYQDTNNLQYQIVKSLAEKNKNIFVVGDDNQSIYSWRGADIQNILNFESDFSSTKVIKLEKNYRSTKNILNISNELIKNNLERKEKTLYTDNENGELINYYEAADEQDEAKYLIREIESQKIEKNIKYNDIAIFYRTNNQSKALEDELILRGIPYTIIGGVGFYQRMEVKDVIAYLRLIQNPDDDLSLKRIINVPMKGIGKVTVNNLELVAREYKVSILNAIEIAVKNKTFSPGTTQKLKNFHELITNLINLSGELSAGELIEQVLEDTSYLDFIENEEERVNNVSDLVNLAGEFDLEDEEKTLENFLDWIALASDMDKYDENSDKLTLMTLHTAKGLEFPYVFITGLEEGLLPHFRSIGEFKQLEEERRLLYVGITRAMKRLYLSSASQRRYFGKTQGSIPSRFLSELPEDLLNKASYEETYGRRYNREEVKYSTNYYDVDLNITDDDPGDSSDGIKKGQGVSHKTFGNGVVLKVEGSGEKAKITVLFKGLGRKTVLASFLD